MTNAIPDYSTWSLDDLINETTRLDTQRAEVSERKYVDEDRQRIRLAQIGARYHAAQAALLARAEPFDPAALARRDTHRDWHLRESERLRAIELGTEVNPQQEELSACLGR